MPRAKVKPSVPEIVPPSEFEPSEAVWRELADECWTVLRNTDRLSITKPLELHFRQAVVHREVLASIAQKWLERLHNANEEGEFGVLLFGSGDEAMCVSHMRSLHSGHI